MNGPQSPDLPSWARASVIEALGGPRSQKSEAGGEPGRLAATFVTIKKDGRLRGCMGTTVPRRPLLEDVRNQARMAALRDPRFPPVQPDELERLRFEVSVLNRPEPLAAATWEQACQGIRTGVDGVIVRSDHGGALFLPQVWESFDRADDFLDQLWKKAQLPHRYFGPDVELSVFSVEKFEEPEPARGSSP